MLENRPKEHPVQHVSPPTWAGDLHARIMNLVTEGIPDIPDTGGFSHPLALRLSHIERLLLVARAEGAAERPFLEQVATASLLLLAIWEEDAGNIRTARYLRAHAFWWQQALQPEWIIHATAIALMPVGAASLRRGPSTLILEHPDLNLQPSSEALSWLERIVVPSVGPDHDPKLRAARVTLEPAEPGKPSVIRLSLGPSTWTRGRGFHRLLEQPGLPLPLRHMQLEWLSALLQGQSHVPDILAVHVACVTSDRALVLIRRSQKVSYAPGCWSLSFEEQLAWRDLEPSEGEGHFPDVLARAVARGAREELGLTLGEGGKVHFLGFYLDLKVLSLGLVALARLPVTSERLKRHWAERSAQGGSAANDAWESDALRCLPLTAVQGRFPEEAASALHAVLADEPLHPTAWLRLKLLLRSDLL